MKYEELSDKAKQNAREWAATRQFDHDWWEHTYEDAVTVGALMGIEVDVNVTRTTRGTPVTQYGIIFSGFWSQGDGACWSGRVKTIEFIGAVERVKAHCGTDEDIWAIAEQAEAIHELLTVHHVFMQLSGDVDSAYNECVPDMVLAITGSERYYSTAYTGDIALTTAVEHAVDKFVDDFAGWIYDQLEKESDWLVSDENLESWLTENEYDFDEDGSPE